MAEVPQTFIDLLNLPVGELRKLGEGAGVKLPKALTRWELAWELSHLSRTTIDKIVGDRLYAGQTATSWIVLGSGKAVGIENLTKALIQMLDHNPFDKPARPKVSNHPQLADARVIGASKAVLTFVVSKRIARVIHDFETKDVEQDEFFVAVLRLDSGVLEVRSSHARARLLSNTWLAELAEFFDDEPEEPTSPASEPALAG
jgi:hypothetical protein